MACYYVSDFAVHSIREFIGVLITQLRISIAVLMIRVENCPDNCFLIVNLLTSPLIMYSKFV